LINNTNLTSLSLIDREFVHKPSSIVGQKPITLGHKYSVLAYLKRDKKTNNNWSIPFSTERVSSCSTESQIAKEQIKTLFTNCPEFNQDKLSVVTADSYYSNQYFLGDLVNYNNNLKFKPMWLIIMGNRKNELNLFDCYQAYLRRFDIEHLFRFAKNKLLLNGYYSTDLERELTILKMAENLKMLRIKAYA